MQRNRPQLEIAVVRYLRYVSMVKNTGSGKGVYFLTEG
jgi:hypothetical protein